MKLIHHAIRMAAFNTAQSLARAIATGTGYARADDEAHALIRTALAGSGDIIPDHDQGTLHIRLDPLPAPGTRRSAISVSRSSYGTPRPARSYRGSRWTIAASRIEAHRASAVALQAVEHTDPDAVVGGPVRGGAAGYPHGRLQVVGQLPVAGAFVADPPRLDWLCCDGGCRGHVDCSDPLFGRRLRAGAAPPGRGDVEPVGSPLVRTTVRLVGSTRKVQPRGSARPVRSTRFTWK